jgi:myo-inositol-1(or 4)-monophosphatase
MELSILYNLGKRLFEVIGPTRLRPFESEALGKGAGGDKTFPIDKTAEDTIIDYLYKSGMPLTVISEEIGYRDINGGGDLKALIDPIDGSKNAINGIPLYCSSIAFVEGQHIGDVVASLVVNLLTGDCFVAQKGKGAFFNEIPIHCQSDDGLYLVAYEAQNPRLDLANILPLITSFRRTRCLGATALDLAYIAYGSISVFVTPAPSRTFDFAGGWLLVKEAGGVVTDLYGNGLEEVRIGLDNKVPILASGNERLHQRSLQLLKPSLPS